MKRLRYIILYLLLFVSTGWAQTPLQLFEQTWSLVESDFVDPTLKGLDSQAIRAEAALALQDVSDKEEAVLKRVETALRPSAYSQAKPAPKPAPKPAGMAATAGAATQPKPAATTPKPAAAQPKPAPAMPKRDDDDDEAKAKAREEAKARQERARQNAAAKAEARKDEEAKERLEKARQEAEARHREAQAEREARAKAEAEATAAAAREEAAALEAASEKQTAAAPKYTQFIAEHTVVAGDNLSFISQRYYGHQGNFRIIYEANRDVIGDNMSLIRPGQVLKIPKL